MRTRDRHRHLDTTTSSTLIPDIIARSGRWCSAMKAAFGAENPRQAAPPRLRHGARSNREGRSLRPRCRGLLACASSAGIDHLTARCSSSTWAARLQPHPPGRCSRGPRGPGRRKRRPDVAQRRRQVRVPGADAGTPASELRLVRTQPDRRARSRHEAAGVAGQAGLRCAAHASAGGAAARLRLDA